MSWSSWPLSIFPVPPRPESATSIGEGMSGCGSIGAATARHCRAEWLRERPADLSGEPAFPVACAVRDGRCPAPAPRSA